MVRQEKKKETISVNDKTNLETNLYCSKTIQKSLRCGFICLPSRLVMLLPMRKRIWPHFSICRQRWTCPKGASIRIRNKWPHNSLSYQLAGINLSFFNYRIIDYTDLEWTLKDHQVPRRSTGSGNSSTWFKGTARLAWGVLSCNQNSYCFRSKGTANPTPNLPNPHVCLRQTPWGISLVSRIIYFIGMIWSMIDAINQTHIDTYL